MSIPFNWPYMTGQELGYISRAHAAGKLSGDGPFTRNCHDWLEVRTGTRKALLTHSCTAALEMIALLLDIKSGDEVIMPSFTFVSTANAFVLRGGVPSRTTHSAGRAVVTASRRGAASPRHATSSSNDRAARHGRIIAMPYRPPSSLRNHDGMRLAFSLRALR